MRVPFALDFMSGLGSVGAVVGRREFCPGRINRGKNLLQENLQRGSASLMMAGKKLNQRLSDNTFLGRGRYRFCVLRGVT
jgi:hypothetical protein